MEVKEAVALAKQYLRDVFSEEKIDNLGLEEVEFDDAQHVWSITLGFSRPWDYNDVRHTVAASLGVPGRREYKIVRIDDRNKRTLAIKNRESVLCK